MIEVYKNLFVGSGEDYLTVKAELGWALVQAAKDPWHREALGYVDRAAPRDHPEYLIAQRGNRLILNIVDAESAAYFNTLVFYQACDFIGDFLYNGESKVLVHCNKGESRGPSIVLVFLAFRARVLPEKSFFDARREFEKIYPAYMPGKGIRDFLIQEWTSGLFY